MCIPTGEEAKACRGRGLTCIPSGEEAKACRGEGLTCIPTGEELKRVVGGPYCVSREGMEA